MGRLWSTWLLLLAFSHSEAALEASYSTEVLSEPTPVKDNLAQCLLTIIRDPGLDLMVNIGIYIKTKSNFSKQEFTHTVERFIASNDRVAVYLGSFDGSNVQGRIYFVDSLKSLQGLVKRHRRVDTDLSAGRQYYLVILPVNVKQPKRLMKQIFHFCWKQSIVNVNILVGGKYGVVNLFTYFPFTATSCGDYTPTIHNRFIDGRFELNKPIFPSKSSNLWQCPVRLSEYNLHVLLLHNERQSGRTSDSYQTLAKTMNFSYSEEIYPEGRAFSYVASVGVFTMLQDGLMDLVAGTGTETKFENFASTNVVCFYKMVLIIKLDDEYSPMAILLFPFDWYTWIALWILFPIKWIAQLLWRRCRSRSIAPSVNFTRFSKMFWLFTMLILSSSYGGSIFKFLRNPPSIPLPKTINEAIDQGYKIVASPLMTHYLRPIPELKNRIIEHGESNWEAFKFFDRLQGKYGFAIFDKFMPEWVKDDEYYIVPDRILIYPILYYMRKFSHLSVEVNRNVHQMHAYGHFLQSQRTHSSRNELFRKRDISFSPKGMSLEQIIGEIQIFCILIVVSKLVFLMEILARYSRRLRAFLEAFE